MADWSKRKTWSRTTHGMCATPLYRVWVNMRRRCNSPRYPKYSEGGGRGITITSRWDHFEQFYEDMKDSYKTGLKLDRKDNDGPYSLKNCRWVTQKEQMQNTRFNRYIETPKGRMILSEASRVSGIACRTLTDRISSGWPVEKLFDSPKRKRN